MPSASLSDLAQLAPGMPCFILEFGTSVPRIWKAWWGTAGAESSRYPHADHVSLSADRHAEVGTIRDSYIKLTRIVTEGSKPQCTSSDAFVVPVNGSTRMLMIQLLQAQDQLKEVSGRAGFWEKLFHETFRDLIGGLGPRIAAEVTKILNK